MKTILPDKTAPALSCSDLAGPTLSLWLADCHSAQRNDPEHECSHCLNTGTFTWISHFAEVDLGSVFPLFLLSLKEKLPLSLLPPPVKCLVGEKLVNWRGRRILSGFWPGPTPLYSHCLFLPIRTEWQLVTVAAPQYDSDPPTIVELRKRIKVFLTLSFTLFSLFSKRRINQLYTRIHTHDSLLLPSLCLFSSQWSFRLDMYCEKLSCSASFFFSFFHSLSLSTVCH